MGELVAGDANIVVMSWNAPGLTVDCVQRAFDLLESGEAGVVIGPAERGGAYLVGLSSRQRGLLSALDDWFGESIESVCERFAGQRVAMLSPWDVVDDLSSLGRLIDALGRDGRRLAPATRAALRRLWERGAPVPPLSQPWEVIASRDLYTSPWRDFIVDTLRTHRGEVIDYARIATPDAVWTVPVTSDGAIVLIHQYRLPVRDWLLEVPAGSIAAGMGEGRLEQAAARELREEIGGLAASLQYQGAFYSSAGQLSLRAHVFLALDVTLDEPELETTELLVPVHVPAELAFEMARRGEIGDGQSALALLMCEAAIHSHLGRD